MFIIPSPLGRRKVLELTGHVQNIDFQTTILSRFDMIFIVKDEHNEQRDRVSGPLLSIHY